MPSEPVTLERLCAAALVELEGVARGAAPARYRATVRRILALVPELTPAHVGAALWEALHHGATRTKVLHVHAAERLVTLNTRARLTKITTNKGDNQP